MNLQTSPGEIAGHYLNVVKAFKKRYDVQNGFALGYRAGQNPNNIPEFKNTPKGIGDGLSTTGWCVSASQALLLDNVFQLLLKTREAKAKLVSIDIREQFYGYVYNGNQNIWHTAIFVSDSGINLIVDITCSQFGNAFVNKVVWDFETWEKTFRSPMDKHVIVDFQNKELNSIPKEKSIKQYSNNFKKITINKNLFNLTTIDDSQRETLSDFFSNKIDIINEKLSVGNINKFDYKYLDTLNSIIKHLHYDKKVSQYHVIEFSDIEVAKRWVKKFIGNDCITFNFMLLSNTVNGACKLKNIENCEKINTTDLFDSTAFIVFEFENIGSFDIDFIDDASLLIPYGIKLVLNPSTDIFNGNVYTKKDEKTNTIYIKATV